MGCILRRLHDSGCDQNAAVAGGEGGVIPRTCLIGRCITGWKRLLGRFDDGCILSPQDLRLCTKCQYLHTRRATSIVISSCNSEEPVH